MSRFAFHSLPTDVLNEVFSWLEVIDLIRLSYASDQLKDAVSSSRKNDIIYDFDVDDYGLTIKFRRKELFDSYNVLVRAASGHQKIRSYDFTSDEQHSIYCENWMDLFDEATDILNRIPSEIDRFFFHSVIKRNLNPLYEYTKNNFFPKCTEVSLDYDISTEEFETLMKNFPKVEGICLGPEVKFFRHNLIYNIQRLIIHNGFGITENDLAKFTGKLKIYKARQITKKFLLDFIKMWYNNPSITLDKFWVIGPDQFNFNMDRFAKDIKSLKIPIDFFPVTRETPYARIMIKRSDGRQVQMSKNNSDFIFENVKSNKIAK